jgi:hypothetical protein
MQKEDLDKLGFRESETEEKGKRWASQRTLFLVLGVECIGRLEH